MIAIKLRWVSLIHKLTANIHVEVFKTPNPNFVKFMPVGCRVLGSNGTLDISSEKYSDVSPLAQELFGVSGVTRVFYGSDYLSVAKR